MDILINQHEILKIKVQQCMILMDTLGYLLMIFWQDGLGNRPDDRFRKLNISKGYKKTGEYIILSEPSEGSKNYFNLHNWVENTKDEIKIFR